MLELIFLEDSASPKESLNAHTAVGYPRMQENQTEVEGLFYVLLVSCFHFHNLGLGVPTKLCG